MGNTSGEAYGLTLLCPIKNNDATRSFADITRNRLEALPLHEKSPLSKVPDTYFCRFYVLNDIFYEGYPAKEEHLKSSYLVASFAFHGDRDTYMEGMWNTIQPQVQHIWEYCVAFQEDVRDAKSFAAYIAKCQVFNNLFFNGSTDDSLEEQLKALYLKQEFSRFVFNNQGKNAVELQQAFDKFIAIVQPSNLQNPTWYPGMAVEHAHHNYCHQLENMK